MNTWFAAVISLLAVIDTVLLCSVDIHDVETHLNIDNQSNEGETP